MRQPDESKKMNGWLGYPMPSPLELLLSIERRIGGLETGQTTTNETMRDGFTRVHERLNDTHDRVRDLEHARHNQPAAANRRSSAAWVKEWAESIAPMKELVLLLVFIALGVAGLTQGDALGEAAKAEVRRIFSRAGG